MHENDAIRFNELTLVGFSLGAHIAGIAGKSVRFGKINTIIGLDPAGPMFSIENPENRLDSTDAEYVECIHTNSRLTGFGLPIGHADFYPNGGFHQPGCITNRCSHSRAALFYFESLNSNSFWSTQCENTSNAPRGCSRISSVTMGGEPSNAQKNVSGIFHLTTNRSPPFAQGRQ